jgi:hypothetical protein
MTHAEKHVLVRGYLSLRGIGRVAQQLRGAMEARSLSAKELAMRLKSWAAEDPVNRWPVDFRTIQNAMQGQTCTLDTYLALSGFFGWDWVESIQAPIHGADPLTSREREVARQLSQVAALQARVERDRAARSQAATGLGGEARERPSRGPRAVGEPRTFTERAPPSRRG